jgi:hypothetical protein
MRALTTAFLFILMLAAPRASAQMRNFQCIATSVAPAGTHITIYVSQLIPMELSQRVPLSGAWGTYVKTTYQDTGPTEAATLRLLEDKIRRARRQESSPDMACRALRETARLSNPRWSSSGALQAAGFGFRERHRNSPARCRR